MPYVSWLTLTLLQPRVLLSYHEDDVSVVEVLREGPESIRAARAARSSAKTKEAR